MSISVEPSSHLKMSEGCQREHQSTDDGSAASPERPQANRPEPLECALHHWSTKQAMEDFSAGFPLLRTIKNSEAKSYLRYVNRLPTPQQERFVAALAPSGETNNPELCPEEVRSSLLLYLSKKAHRRLLRSRGGEAECRITFRHIYEQLHILGKCERRRDSWEFRTPSCGYRIATVVKTAPFLEYCHHVYNPSGFCVLQYVNFLPWYGISDVTRWDYMTGIPDEQSLRLLKTLCIRFVASFPDILALVPTK